MVGFTETLAKEGVKYNILSNVIAPIGEQKMPYRDFQTLKLTSP